MEEYRVDLKVRNNLILSKIESLGFKSALSFCKSSAICYTQFCKFLNMRRSIYDRQGRILPFINKLCQSLNCIPEELFSANQMEASLKDNKRTLKVNEAEAQFMLSQSQNQLLLEDGYQHEQLENSIEAALFRLTDRERKVIEMRNALGNFDREHTLKEVGENLRVNAERIRQIEAKALRKLRHPSSANGLREFLEN